MVLPKPCRTNPALPYPITASHNLPSRVSCQVFSLGTVSIYSYSLSFTTKPQFTSQVLKRVVANLAFFMGHAHR